MENREHLCDYEICSKAMLHYNHNQWASRILKSHRHWHPYNLEPLETRATKIGKPCRVHPMMKGNKKLRIGYEVRKGTTGNGKTTRNPKKQKLFEKLNYLQNKTSCLYHSSSSYSNTFLVSAFTTSQKYLKGRAMKKMKQYLLNELIRTCPNR